MPSKSVPKPPLALIGHLMEARPSEVMSTPEGLRPVAWNVTVAGPHWSMDLERVPEVPVAPGDVVALVFDSPPGRSRPRLERP
jgi:hypothetical protein